MRPFRLRCLALVMKFLAISAHTPCLTDTLPDQLADSPVNLLALLFGKAQGIEDDIIRAFRSGGVGLCRAMGISVGINAAFGEDGTYWPC